MGTPYEMGQMIDNLRKNYQVIVVSTRGHGRSEIGHSELTYEQKANDMLAVIKEVTDEPAVLLGFSDGAYTAYKVASMYPECVDIIFQSCKIQGIASARIHRQIGKEKLH